MIPTAAAGLGKNSHLLQCRFFYFFASLELGLVSFAWKDVSFFCEIKNLHMDHENMQGICGDYGSF